MAIDNNLLKSWFVISGLGIISNAAPNDISLSNNSIDENTTGVVGTLTSPGAFPSPTYSILGGLHQSEFSIIDALLVLDNPQDFETLSALEIEISSTNTEGSYAETFNVLINNISGGFSSGFSSGFSRA